MNIILLSGGSGKRLWPLSNEVRSKQFLKILRKPDGTHESMLQRMHRMIGEVDENASITVATSQNQTQAIQRQIGDADISVEPYRKDTFPAIALAAAYIHEKKGKVADETVVVCPVDPYVEADYFQMLKKLAIHAESGKANLTLMGIAPTYPSTKYGYIIPETDDEISKVSTFREKPDVDTAKKYIEQGALWNSGVFAFKLSYVLEKARELLGYCSYENLLNNYVELPKISFDYAVVEKEPLVQVMRYNGTWKDLGTWNTLTEAMSELVAGNAIAPDCENTHIINELQIPLIALGVKALAIAATPDGILVADKASSDKLKDYVTEQRPMYEKRTWGEYKVLDYSIQSNGNKFLTKHLIVSPGKHISYQIHRHRAEIWTVTDGTGKLILNDEVREVRRGDSVYIELGMKHAIEADTELHIIEVQIGTELTEEDIERLEWPIAEGGTIG